MNHNQTAIILIGPSGTGKTTWAKQYISSHSEQDWEIVSRDDIRTEMMGGTLDWKKWNWSNEPKVTIAHKLKLKLAGQGKRGVIVADTNLNPKFLQEMVVNLKSLGYNDIQFKVFDDISFEEAVRRDSLRGPLKVGEDVIRKQYQAFESLKNVLDKIQI